MCGGSWRRRRASRRSCAAPGSTWIWSGRDSGCVKVVARGKGYGHGIGMCQHGALARAKAGQDFRAILAHYYPGAEVGVFAVGATP